MADIEVITGITGIGEEVVIEQELLQENLLEAEGLDRNEDLLTMIYQIQHQVRAVFTHTLRST